jgi:hypothetical protein
MHFNSDKWIINEFGKKHEKKQVPIGRAFQANIPDLVGTKYLARYSGNDGKREISTNSVKFKQFSINLKKLTETDIISIKKKLVDQNICN